MRYWTFSRTSCCAVVGFRSSLSEAVLLAMLLAPPLLAVKVAPLRLWLLLLGYSIVLLPVCPVGVFGFSPRSETKNDPPAGRREREQRGWEPGVVGVASAKHAPSFGALPALARTDGKGPLSGPSTGAARS